MAEVFILIKLAKNMNKSQNKTKTKIATKVIKLVKIKRRFIYESNGNSEKN